MKNFFHKINEKLFNCELRELKVLFILGLVCLIHIIVKILINDIEDDPVDVIIRSQLIYIFSYLFSTKIKTKSNYFNRNLQFEIASITSLVCLIMLITAHWINRTMPIQSVESIQSLSCIRDIMVASIAFIIRQSRD